MVRHKWSHDDAQTAIFRGCARLNAAMRIKRIAPAAAQKWEDDILLEANDILGVAFKGPLPDLIIPPLPVALIEVQHQLGGQRPMRPSDVHSPLEQASSSPWAVWVTHEDDPRIPSSFDMGDPHTFWWTELEENGRALDGDESEEDVLIVSDSRMNAMEGRSTSVSEAGSSSQSSKRSRVDFPSDGDDDNDDAYEYVPKCDNCADRGWVCRVTGSGYACRACRIKKFRCSARGESALVRRRDASIVKQANKKPRVAEKSKSVIEMLRSQMTINAGAGGMAPATQKQKGTESVTLKRQHVFVAVPPSTVSKSCVRPVERQPANFGPPGGKWKWQKRAERVAAARSLSFSLPSPSQDTTAASDRASISAFVRVGALTSTLIEGDRMSPGGRVLADKCVATENPLPEGYNPPPAEFLRALASWILEVVH